jgi:hypothetical protein
LYLIAVYRSLIYRSIARSLSAHILYQAYIAYSNKLIIIMEAMVESAAAQWKQFGKESTAFVKKCDKPTNENMVGE